MFSQQKQYYKSKSKTKNKTKSKTKTKIKSKIKSKKKSLKKIKTKNKSKKKSLKKIKLFSVTKQLKNGLKIHIKERNKLNNNCILFLVKTGGLNEGKYSGISHLLEHLLLSGTKSYPSSYLFNKALEKYGTKINGYTTQEVTGLHLTFPPSKLKHILKIFSEIIKDSILDLRKIELEKRVVLNEKYHRNDLIYNKFYKMSMKHFFKNTVMEDLVIGDKKSIDLLQKYHLHAYIVSQYLIKNCVIVLSGKFKYTQNEIEKMFKKEFDVDSLTKNYELNELDINYNKYKDELKYFNKINKNISIKNLKINLKNQIFKTNHNQIYVFFYFKIKTSLNKKNEKDEEDNAIQKFINTYLSTGMSSILYNTLREEKHLIYNIKTSTYEFSEFSFYSIQYNLLAENIYLEKSIELIYKVLNDLKNKVFTLKEIKQIKNKRNYRKQMGLNNNENYNNDIGEEILFSNIKSKHYKSFKNNKIDIEKVEPNIIKNYCNKIFNKKNRAILIFSPIKINSKVSKLLNQE